MALAEECGLYGMWCGSELLPGPMLAFKHLKSGLAKSEMQNASVGVSNWWNIDIDLTTLSLGHDFNNLTQAQ